MPTREELDKGFTIGDWEILPARGIFRRGDQEEHPEPKAFNVMLSLAMRDGDLVSKDGLVDECWDGRPTADEAITRPIFQLRGHLGDTKPHQYIETLNRRGYRLMQPVQLKEPPVPAVAPLANRTLSRRNWVAAAVLVVLGIAATVAFWPSPPTGDIQSIGVLPFDNLNTADSDQYLQHGFKEELVHTLSNIPELIVKSVKKDYDEELIEIGEIIDVDGLLSGTVQQNGEMLKITYQIDDARNGHSISSGSITGRLEEIFLLQEQLAQLVRSELQPESTQQLIASSRPANFGAYDSYLRGLYALDHRGTLGNLENSIELFKEAIYLDSQFGPAYLMIAKAYVLQPDLRGAPLAESFDMAFDFVERGIAVDRSIEEPAGAIYGMVYHKQKKWAEAERAFQRAVSADIVDPDAFNWYSRMLASVGRLDDALVQAHSGVEIDPSGAISNSRLAITYTWLDEREKAAQYFERADQLGASGGTYTLGYAWFLSQEGRFDEATERAIRGMEMEGGNTSWIKPFFDAVQDPSKQQAAIDAIDLASEDGQLDPLVEVPVRTVLGDIDGAMSVARVLEQPGEAFEMDILFINPLLALREHPEFLDLMENLGVTDYWEGSGCLWRSAAVHCPKPL
jgi:DNA-binding winged helix-turn-helix (wHTH) protein/TolB-like protein